MHQGEQGCGDRPNVGRPDFLNRQLAAHIGQS
jgi:hypothetical protein